MSGDLIKALVELKEEQCLAIVQQRLDDGQDPVRILEDARRGMAIVGQRYESGTYFIPELIFSGELMRQIGEIVRPRFTSVAEAKHLGQVVLGTVAGDIHDLGLSIVELMLDINGFEVHNLGVDVPADRFVETIQETGATIVGMSGLLTLAYDSMKQTVEAIRDAGLRDSVKIMVGGSQVNDEIAVYAGADACGMDAMAAVRLSKAWIGGR
ncbi:B12-binding domain-containing protein [Chloroflexota bacterium]